MRLRVDADAAARPLQQVMLNTALYQIPAQLLTAHCWADNDSSQRALPITQPWSQASLISEEFLIPRAEHMHRVLIKIIEIQVSTVLLDDEDLLA
jgi:hypothetical protein